MSLKFLSAAPFVLCNLMSPEGAAGGGGATAEPPVPQGNTLEEKLQSASQIIKDFFSQLGGAMSERDEAVTALQSEKDLHAKSEADLKAEQTAHTKTKGDLGTMTSARDGEKTRADKAEGRVTLIESFAKHHNLDLAGLEKFKAVKDVPGGGPQGGSSDGKALYDQWQALKKTDSKKAAAHMKKHRAAIKEYTDSLGD